ncbi:glycosyltransferase [Rhodovarius crocodyli]|uniref:Glycosyltransferase n=1 Tax=Rhodovarius crocodyli TaxID=1979269 RepID=A0A437MP79_9PROT|nr:glycosyltransferase [Rhodovarius crocodyli]RVT99444.1 glycosyltransferase [Rhodovarius crocodyli]
MNLRRLLRGFLARKPWRWRSFALRARADTARRAERYGAALGLYEEYLKQRPDHAMGWVMLGHCLKELGRRTEALDAYAHAASLDPADAFIPLQRAHLLKLEGRVREALDSFTHVAAMAPAGSPMAEAARREATALLLPGSDPAPDAGVGQARCWIDVSDILAYLMHNRTVSGIQRVQLEMARHALAAPDRLACVMTRPWHPGLWAIPREPLREVLRLAEAGQGASPAMARALSLAVTGAALAAPVPGAVLLCSGAFWLHGGNLPLWAATRRQGMRFVVLVYDLIPLTLPRFCSAALVEEFHLAWAELTHFADGFLAISEHSRQSVQDNLAEHDRPALPVTAVPLAHGLCAAPPAPHWTPAIRQLRGKPFVLSVGTLEGRKNHAFLVRLWEALRQEGLAPPPLVLAGKPGWQKGEFDAAMAETRAAGGLVRPISYLSDAEIDTLYGACLFTVFPSLMEGWGLPVGESLARGKLCVASDRGSLPEVGGEYALYIDPDDLPAALPLFRRLLTDRAFLAQAEARIAQGFRPRDWPEVAAAMITAAEAIPPSSHPIPDYPALPAGRFLRIHPATDADPFIHPLRAMLLEGWEHPGSHGTRLSGKDAPLRFAAPGAGTLVLTMQAGVLELPVLPGAQEVRVPGPGTLVGLELRLAEPASP